MKRQRKLMSNNQLAVLFRILNKQYFSSKIPIFKVRFGNIKQEGIFNETKQEITINAGLRKFFDLSALVLLHEMNHAYVKELGYTGVMNDGHSVIFDVGIDRLYKAGAYEGIL